MKVRGYIQPLTGGEPRCPTEICNAVCCRVQPVFPGGKNGCLHLTDDNKCGIEIEFGKVAKPYVCYRYPKSAESIETINKASGDGPQCQLEIKEADDE